MVAVNRSYYRVREVTPSWKPRVEDFTMSGETSNRDPQGNLILSHHKYDKTHYRNTSLGIRGTTATNSGQWVYPNPYGNVSPASGQGSAIASRCSTAASNKAYGKFLKLLRRGQKANLGVTFGSAGQSRDMIVSRLRGVANYLDRKIPPPHYKIPANLYLETIFGWVPLYQDAVDAFSTFSQHDPSQGRQHISASGRSEDRYRYLGTGPATEDNGLWVTRVTWSAGTRVANPNLWLANKLGLLNLAGVAWDLVPWSWVVGMFGNFNQVLSSTTDLVGVEFIDQSVTTTHSWKGLSVVKNSSSPSHWGWAAYDNFEIHRTVSSPLRPKLDFRVPELDAGLCLTALALVTQKWSGRKRDINVHHRRYLTQTGRKVPPEYWHL